MFTGESSRIVVMVLAIAALIGSGYFIGIIASSPDNLWEKMDRIRTMASRFSAGEPKLIKGVGDG